MPEDRMMRATSISIVLSLFAAGRCSAQSADWQNEIWREPQVRYLLADMTLGGNVELYRGYASEEGDPDSKEAIRLWDAGVRVVNATEFERKRLANPHGRDGRVMRIVERGTLRTITGNEVMLSNDGSFAEGLMRLVILDLTLGRSSEEYEKASEPHVIEALRRWSAGCRAMNADDFSRQVNGSRASLVFRVSGLPADGARVVLNSDRPYGEANVRYFMIDIALGGSIEFYRRAAERDHEMACLEAVRRTEEGFAIANIGEFERKKVAGRTTVTRRGENRRIHGMEVILASDRP